MKQATVLATFIIVVCSAFARPLTSNDLLVNSSADTSTVKAPGIHEMLEEIVVAAGLQSNFELKQANVLNIEASVSHKKRYILYNPAYINSLSNITKSKWTVMALLAHEVGHHLNGHTMRRGGSAPGLELEADEFAGFILHKLGATLEQAQHVMHFIAKTKESRTHPSRKSRLLAIEKGWNRSSSSKLFTDTAKK